MNDQALRDILEFTGWIAETPSLLTLEEELELEKMAARLEEISMAIGDRAEEIRGNNHVIDF